jgi:urocanate hydratase
MKDGSDSVADWALLNCMTNVASGATWVSFHDGVDIGYALHAGQVTVADGIPEAENQVTTVLRNEPLTGIIRHSDAGYDTAIEIVNTKDVKVPMIIMHKE